MIAAILHLVAFKAAPTLSFNALPIQTRGSSSRLLQNTISESIPIPNFPSLLENSNRLDDVRLSGLGGLALVEKEFPTKLEALAVIPSECFEISEVESMKCLLTSLTLTSICAFIGATSIPMTFGSVPLWIIYALVTGTVAMGNWVLAHECGHGSFSNSRKFQDALGFVLHSALLVPYFSWKRSHAVHHAFTNHIEDGETHVPSRIARDAFGALKLKILMEKTFGQTVGENLMGMFQLAAHLLIGWPAYLIIGSTGGPSRGTTNHFVPTSDKLFPGKWKGRVWLSSIGVLATFTALACWAFHDGIWRVSALYLGPYIVVNAWLVIYTWLQHTNSDVPHFDSDNFSFVKGAFHSIDRPYGKVIDFLHHRIGSTHVAHHLDSSIPHYNAIKATDALKSKFPEHYLYDPTPVPLALWRVAKSCLEVEKRESMWLFVQKPLEKANI
mmetsp:Transcript_5518/g.8330  ORF Transcript_5518/g.8330 Transcript_5518/m.8330 type:complete len:442 (+) Transcript_5518:81-1406(+)